MTPTRQTALQKCCACLSSLVPYAQPSALLSAVYSRGSVTENWALQRRGEKASAIKRKKSCQTKIECAHHAETMLCATSERWRREKVPLENAANDLCWMIDRKYVIAEYFGSQVFWWTSSVPSLLHEAVRRTLEIWTILRRCIGAESSGSRVATLHRPRKVVSRKDLGIVKSYEITFLEYCLVANHTYRSSDLWKES